MDPVEISAGRLHLRPWDAGDVGVLLRGGSDPAIARWTQVPAPYTRADAEDFACRYVPEQWAGDGELVWAVCDATTGAPLASVGLHAPHQPGMREVGFWCLPEARGAGVVVGAVQAVARWAFAELRLARLEWATEVGNAASLRVAVKAGFTYEGRRRASLHRRDGSRVDAWWAARLPGDGPGGAPPALPDPGTVTGDGLALRHWRTDDAEPLATAYGGAQNALPPSPGAMTPDEHARWWVSERAPENWASGDGAPFAVVASDGSLLGSLQLHRKGRRPGIAEVGVWVAPAARRQAVATRAVEALLGWGVPALGLARVEWHADPGNAASLALATRLGFVREGLAVSAFPGEAGEDRSDSVVLARVWS
jgi:RimJ/RimL family protein N-acetyltransferase